MMRLCERDGAFDFTAYEALCTRVSWDEAQRISTALVVIGDEREDWSAFRSKGGKGGASAANSPLPSLSVDDWRRELANNEGGYDRASKTLQAHRHALASGESEGRLDPDQVELFEGIAAIHRTKIEEIKAELAKLVTTPVSD